MRLQVGIEFFGHAAVGLWDRRDGSGLLIDPYEPGGFGGRMAYQPIKTSFGAVVCSHEHEDHCAVEGLQGEPEVLRAEVCQWRGFSVERVKGWHDEYEGKRMGGEVDLLRLEVGGISIVHASDVGHAPTKELVQRLRRPDLLLMPVGGFFTVGAAQAWEWTKRLNPKVVVPIHYKSESCALRIRGVENFLAYFASNQHLHTLTQVEEQVLESKVYESKVWHLPMTHE